MVENKKKDLSNQAYDILEHKIITLELAPGSQWTVNELSELIGIGKMPTRDAIKKLSEAYLVKIIPRKGLMITEYHIEDFFLQMEVRRPLERLLAMRAARFSNKREKERFLELARKYEEATVAEDENSAIEIDNEFNKFIGKCARNPYAYSAIKPLHSVARRMYYLQYNLDKELTKKINYAHVYLMEAIASGDENEAGKRSDELLDYIEQLNSQVFQMYR